METLNSLLKIWYNLQMEIQIHSLKCDISQTIDFTLQHTKVFTQFEPDQLRKMEYSNNCDHNFLQHKALCTFADL